MFIVAMPRKGSGSVSIGWDVPRTEDVWQGKATGRRPNGDDDSGPTPERVSASQRLEMVLKASK